jgi:glycerol-1-phosphate dehydrogenase [NAD(P)+]
VKKVHPLPSIELMPVSVIDERRSVLLITSSPAWNAVKGGLRLEITSQLEPLKATTQHWDALITPQPNPAEVVYAVGGGLVADAGKYIASRLDLSLVLVPTALTVDAFFTATAGVREKGCVTYIEAHPPDRVVVDFEVIASAPPSLRAAGISDVLSILTGSWDWQFAHQRSMNPPGMEFIPWVYESAQSILHGALDCAEAAGSGDPAGLKQLLDCLCMEVQLCNQVGHARPEEGSEHYFAYCAEQHVTGAGWSHADLLAPGILLMAELQGQVTHACEAALLACHVPINRIPPEAVESTLLELPVYCQRHNLPFGLAHTLS